MARVWFIVAVLIHIVYANEFQNCDECVRKGGTWCNKLGSDHCSTQLNDDWCPYDKEMLPSAPTKGQVKKQAQRERRLYVGNPAQLDIPYVSPTKLQVNVSIVHSTQSKNITVAVHRNECVNSKCTVTIEATPTLEFCFPNGTVHEYAYAKVIIENKEHVTIKYHIACACMCTEDVKVDSMDCHGHGNLSCGMCTCHNGWYGDFCETKKDSWQQEPTKGPSNHGSLPNNPDPCNTEFGSPKCNFRGNYMCGACQCRAGWTGNTCDTQICGEKRGDMQCTNPAKDDVECSGNGFCGVCDTCVCYTDRVGSQYFEEDNYCTDLCMVSNNCDTCLINNTLQQCPDCYITAKLPYNETVTRLVDNYNRSVWVKCNETVGDCYVEYWAMRDENDITIMVQKSCNDAEAGYVSAGPKVPLIMGILGLIAAVAAVAGVLAWKHFNTVPPLPLSDPEYQNIDAEDCTGENPLYKSPMSSFKNPTYGKW